MADNPYERDTPVPDDAADGASSARLQEGQEDRPDRVEDGPYGEDSTLTDTPAPVRRETPDQAASPSAGEPGLTGDEPVTPAAPADGTSTTPDDAAAEAPVPVTVSGTSGDDAVTSTFDLRDRPGDHQAERPVPRSGLTEHRSAGYLTGELSPPEPVTASPATAGAAPATAQEQAGDQPATAAAPVVVEEAGEVRTGPDTAVVLEGATASPKLPSRAAAHVWGIILTLLLTPVAWYLLADAGARLTLPAGNPWDTANLNIAALLELAGGLLVLAIVLLAARWSSVGAIVVGALVLVVGVPFLAVPAWTQDLLGPVTDWLDTLGGIGTNTAAHLVTTGSTGRFVVYGLALILIGVVSHGARRQGRREMRAALTV